MRYLLFVLICGACTGSDTSAPKVQADPFAKFAGTWRVDSILGKWKLPASTIATATDTFRQERIELVVTLGSGPIAGFAVFTDSAYDKSYLGASLGWWRYEHTVGGLYSMSWTGSNLFLTKRSGNAQAMLEFGIGPDGRLRRYVVGIEETGERWVKVP